MATLSAPVTDTDGFQQLVYADAMSRIAAASDYQAVGSASDFRVTAVPTQRKVTVEPGTAYSAFILARMGGTATLEFDAPSSGGFWYWIVLERSWAGAGSCRVVALPAGATTSPPYLEPPLYMTSPVPPAFRFNPGQIVHQKLAAVWVGSASPAVVVIDLRYLKDGRPAMLGLDGGIWTNNRDYSGDHIYDSFAGDFAGLAAYTIPDAPAGEYEYKFFAALAATSASIGFLRIEINGYDDTQDIRHDLDGQMRILTFSKHFWHPGGRLYVNAQFKVNSGIASIYNPGSGLQLHYSSPPVR